MDAFYIIVTASLFSIACGILGTFLVLRQMAMVGDAISHAVLPGIVLAFLFSGSRGTVEMLIGAGLLGVLTTVLIHFLHHKAKLQNDAAIGVSFTSLFALGIILLTVFANDVDLDQDCVLYGEIAYVPLDLLTDEDGNIYGPRAMWLALGVVLVNILLVTLGYKKLSITSFDPAFAASIGIATGLWNYLLMGAVSLTTVAAFDSVGAILVVALLVVPAATAYLVSTKLQQMLLWVCVFSIVNSALGYVVASWLNGSIAGAMVTVSGGVFVVVFIGKKLADRSASAIA